MKAITTKYCGPTDYHGSRITASDGDGHRVTWNYRHEMNSEENHRCAADLLCERMGWTGRLEGGQQKPGVMVFVFVPKY